MVSSPLAARLGHGATALAAALGLAVQLVLVLTGASVLVEEQRPDLAERLVHFVSYFTVLSNALVLVTSLLAARRPDVGGRLWSVLRLDAVVGITVTGLVHWFWLRPLLRLTGWSFATDKVLHVVVPVLAVTGWLLFGPRPRIDLRVVLLALLYPVGWLALTLAAGVVTGWYPYPFLDVGARGVAPVALACAGVAMLFLALSALAWLVDRRAKPVPAASEGR